MAEQKSLVEEALIQMKNLENVVSENAKGILASTMKEEIGELVKESLKEAEEENIDITDDMMAEADEDELDTDETEDMSDEMGDMGDMSDMEDETEMSMDDEELSMDSDDETVDLRGFSDEEVLKVFKAMGEEDGIIVTKDDSTIDLEDENTESHYKISLGESDDEMSFELPEGFMDDEESEYDLESGEEDEEEYEFEEGMGMDEMYESEEEELEESDEEELEESEEEEEFEGYMEESDEEEEIVYELDLGGDDEEELDFDFDSEYGDEEDEDSWTEIDLEDEPMFEKFPKRRGFKEGANAMKNEGFKPKGMGMGKPGKVYPKSLKHGVTEKEMKESMKKKMETKEGMKSIKPKGMGMGKPKFEYKESKKMETKEGMKSVKPKGMGMGKPKFEYEESENMDMKPVKKGGETKEASRTLGSGKAWGRQGLNKRRAAPSHLRVESTEKEVAILRERNEEYRKALNVFRTKLNEVAVFNSNLAYATRLFTEHSTTKQEKINILRRFDGVESLKESKALYKTIKDELSNQKNATVVKESIDQKINRTPSSGSAVNLIESKTYENPQFMRMKDLMSKMNIAK